MTLKQLEYFRQVCRHNNLTKAASELYISQPTLTLAIHQLEEELGLKLFVRKNKRIYLTREGEYFLERSTSILLEDCILPSDPIAAVPLQEQLRSEIGIITKKGARIYPGTERILKFFKFRFGEGR